MRLNNKVAIITGATGGIGEATAWRFLDEGARVMLVGRSTDKLSALVERLDGGDSVAHAVAEAGDEQANATAIAACVERFGGLDIMLANAGTEGSVLPLEDQSLEDFEALLRTNVLGVWLSIKHSVEPMRQRGGGSIIALGSIVSVIGSPGLLPYIASKHAVAGMLKTAAVELGEANIRVNAIGPGPIQNRMIDSIFEQAAGDGEVDAATMADGMREAIPLKRFGRNEEVANLALFLASDESSYCSGGIHMIDGGFTAA
ncbi:SDR family oxidoreductase [Wenzhouxiangella sp. XN79A]|uniref:SDR family NAD(P)-dependent oxidoreductase n=1 Tax=Wenzhouxiangella sp. XN79A TaxID=2724193 RepID=UPI00144A4D77|nr:SDR family NAD(P)-dependent oxidoreductase [Wenzhouxiangella sp. XN79A]NKI36375.1 SDR family oxidoreductase [Wenzhouxiangella sp. XN79A]